jgi:hypothetical protein
MTFQGILLPSLVLAGARLEPVCIAGWRLRGEGVERVPGVFLSFRVPAGDRVVEDVCFPWSFWLSSLEYPWGWSRYPWSLRGSRSSKTRAKSYAGNGLRAYGRAGKREVGVVEIGPPRAWLSEFPARRIAEVTVDTVASGT